MRLGVVGGIGGNQEILQTHAHVLLPQLNVSEGATS